MTKVYKKIKNKGFTLVELLVVISILGILASVTLVAFRSSQIKGRDTKRKSDLKQIAASLELYYSDYNQYPDDSAGKIAACPSTSSTACPWGSGEFTDTKTIYFRTLPEDPSDYTYYYRIIDSGTNQKFQLYAYLENAQDPSLISSGISTSCGNGKTCNFAITSSNTTPEEGQ